MVDPQDRVTDALRRVLAASDALNDAADALRNLTRHLQTPETLRAVQYASPDLDIEAATALERLDMLGDQRAHLLDELQVLQREHEVADADSKEAAAAADAAMRELGAAEADLDHADPEYLGAVQQRIEEARASARDARAHAEEARARKTAREHRAEQLSRELEMTEVRIQELRNRLRHHGATQTQDVPVRELALQALTEIGLPSPSNLLSRYIAGRFGREIKSNRWGPLRADERAAIDRADEATRRERVWLQPARDSNDRELTRLWVRSDWPESHKTVKDLHDWHLLQARAFRLAELAVDPPEDTADPKALEQVALDEAIRVNERPHHNQDQEWFLDDLAQRADYVEWPPPPPPSPPSDDDVPF